MPSNELDVQIHVSECIPDFGGNCHLDPVLTPRRPNVVSHRGHELTVSVTILSLPPGTTEITLRAHVIEHGPDRLGTEEFIFGAARLFGTNPGETFPAPSRLPHVLSIRVSELGSDHLGQGPYEVIVNVEPSGGEPLTAPAANTSNGIHILQDRTFFLKFISI